MTSGTVKWFNPTKGYGFIEPSDGSKDAFVHISAVERAGLTTLNEGQKVEYELVPDKAVSPRRKTWLLPTDAARSVVFVTPAPAPSDYRQRGCQITRRRPRTGGKS